MFRGFIPFLLATLGLILFVPGVIMPLFEWKISEADASASFSCSGNAPSSVITTSGKSLDPSSNPFLPEHLSFVVRSSPSGRIIERMTRGIHEDSIPLFWFLIFLCGIYTSWYASYHERPVAEVLISPVVAMLLLCILINVGRLFSSPISGWWCFQGRFNAELSKIHYETLLTLIAGLFAGIGAFVMMLRQIIKAIMPRNESSKMAVG